MRGDLKKVLAGVFLLAGSSAAMAGDGGEGYERYGEMLNKQYSRSIEKHPEVREAEFEVERVGDLLILEVEAEAGKGLSDERLLEIIEPALDKAAAQLKEDFDGKLRVVVEREDRIIRSENL